MLRLIALWLSVMLLSACSLGGESTATPEPTPNAVTLAAESAAKVSEADTLRLEISQSGIPNYVLVDLGQGIIQAIFRRAVGQYAAPGEMAVAVRLIVAGLPLDVDIYSNDGDQWYRALFTGNRWLNVPFAEGFDPADIITEDTGIRGVLNSLLELQYVASENLEDNTPVYHLKGRAEGEAVSMMLDNLVTFPAQVIVDAFIHRETLYPVRLVLVQTETANVADEEPTTWTIDVYDVNAELEITPPADSGA